MFKRVFLLLGVVCCACSVKAQWDTTIVHSNGFELTITDSIEVPYDEMMDSVFALLDRTPIINGYLLDRGFQFLDPHAYEGEPDSGNTAHAPRFRAGLGTLYTSHMAGIEVLPSPDELDSLIELNTSVGHIPLLIMAMHYNEIKPNAFTDSLLMMHGVQIVDVSGRPESPYSNEVLFIATPAINRSKDSTITFKLDANCIFTNITEPIQQIWVDFGNGSGYIPMSLGQTAQVTYSGGAMRTIKVKVEYGSGILRCHSLFEPQLLYYSTAHNTFDLTSLNNQHSGVTVSIAYSCDNTLELDRPLIVVEGFDPPSFGNTGTYSRYRTGLGNELRGLLEGAGYDLVYIDFHDGADDLWRNAQAVKDVIRKVNEIKSVNAYENVVLGESMGGLLARIALRQMENAMEDHDTRLYISLDAPHQGANVPVGFEFVTAELFHIKIRANYIMTWMEVAALIPGVAEEFPITAKDVWDAATSEAAQQMLIQPVIFWDDLFHKGAALFPDPHLTFQAVLDNLGYPQQCRTVTLANGSGISEGQGFDANALILDAEANSTQLLMNFLPIDVVFRILPLGFGECDIQVNASPDATQGLSQVADIFVRSRGAALGRTLLNKQYSAEVTLPYDNAPGGMIPVAGVMPVLPVGINVLAEQICFVPT
ncbi:MAG: hypothetical protein M3Q97_07020, partial [Bacteroidota bacterium]|nr:hypothetical protein [Bacteroidota bacterium]